LRTTGSIGPAAIACCASMPVRRYVKSCSPLQGSGAGFAAFSAGGVRARTGSRVLR
jgi:hypothetical protein